MSKIDGFSNIETHGNILFLHNLFQTALAATDWKFLFTPLSQFLYSAQCSNFLAGVIFLQ